MTSENSAPLPVGFEPAVPLPVIPPRDVEQSAIAGLKLNTPEQTAAKVAEIDRDAAERRAIRDQHPVTEIEQQIERERDTRAKYEAQAKLLADLRAKLNQ